MKTNLFLLTMLAGTLPLASCDKNNPADELPGPQPPAVSTQAEAALNELRNGISDFSARLGNRLLGNS